MVAGAIDAEGEGEGAPESLQECVPLLGRYTALLLVVVVEVLVVEIGGGFLVVPFPHLGRTAAATAAATTAASLETRLRIMGGGGLGWSGKKRGAGWSGRDVDGGGGGGEQE